MSALIEKVRALYVSSSDANSARNMAGAATSPDSSSASSTMCHEVGHIRRFCPKRKGHHGSGSGMSVSRAVCFFCEMLGHFIRECRERKAWLVSKSGKAAALEACAHNADPCLSLTAQASRGSLPRMFVNIHPGGDASLNGQEERLTSAVDTGSTHTLIARNCVDQLGIVMHAKGSTDIVSLDGELLAIQGTAWVRLQREGGPVRLPPIDMKASVVHDLSTVQSDVLIGSDIIIGTAGLSLEYDENQVLCGIRFGPEPMSESVSASVATADKHPFPFVEVTHENDDVVLKVDDGEVRWMAKEQYWQARWQWKDTG